MARKKEYPGLVDQLIEAIRESGQSLNQLSVTCGVGRDRLSRFVRGERDLTLSAADKICRVLRLELVSQDEEAESPQAEKKGRRRK